MKYILHIAAKLCIGGAEKVARDIGLYSDPLQYQNHYIVFEDVAGAYEQQLVEYGCQVFHVAPPSAGYIEYLNFLEELMRKYSYTVVHAHTMFNGGWAMYVAKRMGVPIRVTHAHSALDTNEGLKVKFYEIAMRYWILNCATDLIACGEKAGIRLFGEKAYKERAHLILNGINTEEFRFKLERRREIRKILGIDDCFVIGHVGHLAEVKNQKYLLQLMPQILKKRSNAKLLLLGEGEDRTMLEQKIVDLSLENTVIMTGNVMNVADYLNAMDAFAFPSLYEGMPLSIIEVQANGLPCVLSTGVPEDVYLTDLIRPLSLDEPDNWIAAICSCQRNSSEEYASLLQQSGLDVASAMRKIYDLYERRT